MTEAEIKGSILKARLNFVRERAGEAALERVLERLDRADQDVLRGVLIQGGWYPMELNLRLDDAITDELSPTNREASFLDMGRHSADLNLTGAHKVWVSEGDPHALLDKSERIYRMYYAVGHRTYERTGKRSGIIRTFEAESVTVTDCLTVVGWYKRAIELCGGRHVKVREVECRARGADHCEYLCEWD